MHKPLNAPENFEWFTKLVDWKELSDTVQLLVKTNTEKIQKINFSLTSNNCVRCFFKLSGEPNKLSPMLDGEINYNKFHIEDRDEFLVLYFDDYKILISKDPFNVKYFDVSDEFICGDNTRDVDGLGRPFVMPLGFFNISGEEYSITNSFHLRQDEHLFGLGEKFTRLDKSGQKIISWTQDAFGSTSERSHKNIPFLWSTKGYGYFLNSTGKINWDLGVSSCQSWTVEIEDNTYDAFLMLGQTPADILKKYSQLTGFSPLPPKWSFGLWVSSGGTYRDQQKMNELIDGLEKNNIAADVVHIDPWWMRWRKYCDFVWNREEFPEIEKFIDKCHQLGLKICLWEHPYLSVESELYNEGVENNYLVKNPDGEVYIIDYGLSLAPRPDGVVRVAGEGDSWNAPVAIIDLSNPKAVEWFKELHRPILEMGIDVFKTDFGEDIPHDAVFYNGETGRTIHNLYPLLYNKAVYEITEEVKGKGVVWSRAGTAGNQKYPVCWSADPAADFESLACTIRGGLSIGLSGIPFWSNDIGGYRGMPSDELYIRWAQFGLLCSHSRMHGDSPREPWYFSENTLNIVRDFIELRYELFPYIYNAAIAASKSGLPVLRAMALSFPDDPNCYDKDLQFMLGDSILVAPVYNESGKRYVYLPKGNWFDFWNKELVEGNQNINTISDLTKIPIFIKAGAVIPRMQNQNRIPQDSINPIIFEIYFDGSKDSQFYEDEGVTKINCRDEGEFSISIQSPIERQVIVRLFTSHKILNVKNSSSDNLEFSLIDKGYEIKSNQNDFNHKIIIEWMMP